MNTETTYSSSLQITEIFYSLQGESLTVGLPTIFIRLSGCPFRCSYCDSVYAFDGGEAMSLEQTLEQVFPYKAKHVTVTGGEPLAQKGSLALMQRLCDLGYNVALETSGALPIDDVDPRVTVVMDLKTPGSGEEDNNNYANIARLKEGDQVKFVICDRNDYEWSKDMACRDNLNHRLDVIFSPNTNQLQPQDLAQWILDDQLAVRFQLQLHKTLWGDKKGV
ncbi:MAG: 7-carboxy-7-deazaguanine synthase QueE [Gammaproteobacteria bacterium]|nr:MAG: 7-carboxy-7-deazaguanine synthase QueE [Gammaproteobacteria bacterium]